MYQCPNCGGNLRFDIASQALLCDYCHTSLDPYSVNKEQDAEERTMYDVTIFTCPQCGGEIMSTETSAAEFCSFCGASTILSGRLSSEKKPNYIIPFKKTKEDCKEAYKKLVKHAFFAPKELKDSKFIEKFRGIYMPYWSYYVTQNGNVALNGEKTYRRGNYIYTDHYRLSCNINAYYKGLSYDASSSFDDTISQNIAPFDVKGMKEFTPSILSGFYADIADVGNEVYSVDAFDESNSSTFSIITSSPEFSGFSINAPGGAAMNSTLNTQCANVDSTMFPVWFMSYRKGNRVAYATVNGQTGKASADLPASVGKYLIFSFILAIPIFLLFNFLFTFRPVTTLVIASVLSLITSIIYNSEIAQIVKRDSREDDRGYLVKNSGRMAYKRNPKVIKSKKKISAANSGNIVGIIIFIFIAVFAFFVYTQNISSGTGRLPMIIILVGQIIAACIGHSKVKKTPGISTAGVSALSLISVIVSTLIALIKPVSDIPYYAATVLSLIFVFVSIIQVMNKYNILATRPLPQFNRAGGDNRG